MIKKRIVLVVLDSLALWILERFNKTHPDSFIAKMVREGLSFTNNYSTCSYSFPSYPSILFEVIHMSIRFSEGLDLKLSRKIL